MMRVVYSNPPWITDDGLWGCGAGSRWPYTDGRGRQGGYIPYPFFSGYACSYAKEKGVDAYFIDAIALGLDYNKYYDRLKKINPDIVIIETTTPSIKYNLRVAEAVKSLGYEVCLVGAHATIFAGDLIKLPFVDYVLKGEYEKSSLEMVTTREKKIYDYNPLTKEEVEVAPFPYRDKEHFYRYSDLINVNIMPLVKKPQLQIYDARGCSGGCNYCLFNAVFYRHSVRLRSPESILAEVDYCIKEYGIKDIFFDSDAWGFGGKERVWKIAEGLKARGIPWTIMTRGDIIKKEWFPFLKECGCYAVRIGVETFSQRLLDIMGKKEKIEEVIDVLNSAYSSGLKVHMTIMWNYLGETEEDRKITREKLAEFAKKGIIASQAFCIPFAGTPYYEMLINKGLKIDDWECYDGNIQREKTKKFLQQLDAIVNKQEITDIPCAC